MFRRILAVVLCGALVTTGCASAGGPRYASRTLAAENSQTALDRATLAEYAQRIPAGAKVRVERTTGRALHGTLLKSNADSLTVQLNTRIPEPPIEVPYNTITRLTLEKNGSSVGKNIAIGVASGVGVFFGIVGLLALIYND